VVCGVVCCVSAPTQEGASGAGLTRRIVSLINQQPIMLFMKGSPSNPQCGFSKKAVALLRAVGGADLPFGTFDIFTDESVRMGLKEYSKWPTYPQVWSAHHSPTTTTHYLSICLSIYLSIYLSIDLFGS
jgi:glutaredoxin-related protein